MSTTTLQSPAAAVSLRGPGGNKTFQPKSRFGSVGIAVMVAAHLLIGYGLATGLAGKAIEIIKRPIDATIIEEVKLPPPPPPPKIEPKIEKIETTAPPPPDFVPKAEVAPPAVIAPVVTAVQNTQPVAPPPAPPEPKPVVAAPTRADIALACPHQVKPKMPQDAIDDGVGGTVRVEVHIRGGKVQDMKFLSGPSVFYPAVKAAVIRYECNDTGGAVIATQDFTFQVQE